METLPLQHSPENLSDSLKEEQKSPIVQNASTTGARTALFLEKTENYIECCPLKNYVTRKKCSRNLNFKKDHLRRDIFQ